jgi:hypothetical protein
LLKPYLWIFWLQKCLSTADAVTSSCGPVATHRRTGKSGRGPSSEERSKTSHLMARCKPLYRQVLFFVSFSLCLNFKHFIIYVLSCDIKIHVITHILSHVYDVLCINVSVLATHKDPGYD